MYLRLMATKVYFSTHTAFLLWVVVYEAQFLCTKTSSWAGVQADEASILSDTMSVTDSKRKKKKKRVKHHCLLELILESGKSHLCSHFICSNNHLMMKPAFNGARLYNSLPG